MSSNIFPVVLSGGSGTRLWPVSRSMRPKQFIHLFGPDQPSLLGATLLRLPADAGFQLPTILCNNDHRFLVQDELAQTGIEARQIILEPVARNTAPAIAVAAHSAVADDPDAIIVVMPSDHAINDPEPFLDGVRRAGEVAATGKLVLFGIEPRSPHTGYGYIKRGRPLDEADGRVFEVGGFFEKPDQTKAESYVSEGGYYWNSGIFVLHAGAFLEELKALAPEIDEASRQSLGSAQVDLSFLRLEEAAFARSPSISVDYAVMEKTDRAAVLPLEAGWSDVGSWTALAELGQSDEGGNTVSGDVLLEDTQNCYVDGGGQLVATLGLSDAVVVSTPDAILVADKERAQDVGRIVSRLKQAGRREHEQHRQNYRPWGFFETLSLGERFQVKLLHVKPGGKLSLQMHHHRSEHWVVVSGTAKVTIDETERFVREGESVYISVTQWHRLENPGKVPLEIIEVQLGAYLGEDDILRSDDVYRRSDEETK